MPGLFIYNAHSSFYCNIAHKHPVNFYHNTIFFLPGGPTPQHNCRNDTTFF